AFNAVAPAGVRCCAATSASGNFYVKFYLFAGRHADTGAVIACARGDYGVGLFTSPPDPFVLRTALIAGTVDGTIQSEVAGAQATPALAVGLGQPYLRLTVYPVRASDNAQTNLPTVLPVDVAFDVALHG